MQLKIDEKPASFETKAFEVVFRKSAYYEGNIVIGTHRVNKQSEDFKCD